MILVYTLPINEHAHFGKLTSISLPTLSKRRDEWVVLIFRSVSSRFFVCYLYTLSEFVVFGSWTAVVSVCFGFEGGCLWVLVRNLRGMLGSCTAGSTTIYRICVGEARCRIFENKVYGALGIIVVLKLNCSQMSLERVYGRVERKDGYGCRRVIGVSLALAP